MINDYPALDGRPVTAAHARICQTQGHATHTVDGVDSGICPRCGEPTNDAPAVHWHVAHGLQGYGPDAADSDGFFAADDVRDVAEAIRYELADDVDACEQSAEALADSGDYESAWKAHKRADALEIMRANLDNARADSPLYRGRPDAWQGALRQQFAELFPADVSDYGRLYVWQCTEPECAPTED